MKGVAPDAELCFALTQKRTNKALKGLRQSGIRNVALVLVELAGGKKAARRNERLMEFIDDGGLTDTGIAGNEDQLRRAAFYDAIKASEQCLDFPLAAVEFLQNQKPVWCVVLAKRKLVDPPMTLPFTKTAPQIALNAACRLVSLLGSFGKQLHDDCRDSGRDIVHPLAWRRWLSCNMAMHPFHRIGSREGKTPGQHFVKCDAEGVEVA